MQKERKVLIVIIFIILSFGYILYSYIPETGSEAEHLNEISNIIKSKEYSKLDNLPMIELNQEHQKEKEYLIFYAKALQAEDRGDVSEFNYYLYRIPKDYEGRLSEDVNISREEAKKLLVEWKKKEADELKKKQIAENKEANAKIIKIFKVF